MQSKWLNFSKFAEIFYNKINKKFLYFIIGDRGINLIKEEEGFGSEEFFCLKEEVETNQGFIEFIKKHSKSNVRFIINNSTSTLQHENIPFITYIGSEDPIEKYCDTHLHSSDIYAYKILSISKEAGDVWKAVVNWHHEDDVIRQCLSYVKDCKVPIDAIYFYNFAVQSVADEIAKEYRTNLNGALYTTTFINKASGISFTFNIGSNILISTQVEYPEGKHAEYIQGVIEQNLADLWLKYKVLADSQPDAKKVNIFIVPTPIRLLLEKEKNDIYQNLFANSEPDLIFMDSIFVKYLSMANSLKAVSKQLKSYYRYNLVNNVLFKPVYFVMLILFLYMIYLQSKILRSDQKLSSMYLQYSKISEEIRLKAQDYPTIANITQLADLSNVRNILLRKTAEPFEMVQDFIELNKDKYLIKKISWELTENNNYILCIDLSINADPTTIGRTVAEVESLVDQLKKKYPNEKIGVQRSSIVTNDLTNDATIFSLKIYSRGPNDSR